MRFFALLVWLSSLLALPAGQDGGPSLSAQAGFDGLYQDNAPIPVVVTASNDGAGIEGELRVQPSSGAGGVVYSAPISLPAGSNKRVPLVIHAPQFGRGLVVQLVSDGQVINEVSTNRLNNVSRSDLLYGVITPDPGGLAFLETIPGSRPEAAVAFLAPADLPEVSSAWNALDVLVIDDTDTGRLTAGQLAALRAWIESGGQLVVTGGPGGPQTAAGVADLLPVTVSGVESLAALPALEEFAGQPPVASGPYVVTASTLRSGELLVQQEGIPLLARRDLGRGTVYFLALDPKLAPLSGWSGGSRIWETIATNTPVTPPWAVGIQDGYAAAQAVSYVPGLRLPSIWQLILFLIIYAVVIGPINFIVLRRLNRRELAWITIPALVLLFSAITFLTGFRTRGNTATLNVMSVAFGSAEADRLRTQSVIGLYSPRRAQYDVALPYDSSAFPFRGNFGTLTSESTLDTVERGSELILRGLRTDTSEVATFIVEAHQPRPAIHATASLTPGDGTASVAVTIRNDTAETLENAVLIYGQNMRAVGNIAPGEAQTVDLRISIAAAPPIPTPDPMFLTGGFYAQPLINDPSIILGTADYFNDPVAYPRWQLIQSHYTGDTFDPATLPDPTQFLTLGGWLAGSDQEASVSGGNSATRTGQTLLLLEIPLR